MHKQMNRAFYSLRGWGLPSCFFFFKFPKTNTRTRDRRTELLFSAKIFSRRSVLQRNPQLCKIDLEHAFQHSQSQNQTHIQMKEHSDTIQQPFQKEEPKFAQVIYASALSLTSDNIDDDDENMKMTLSNISSTRRTTRTTRTTKIRTI